jgi:hypothetical protein
MITDEFEIQDSIVAATITLRPDALVDGTLSLPPVVLAELAEHPHYVLRIVQPFGDLADDERSQRVTLDGGTLRGIDWPLSFVPGARLDVSTARGARGCRIRVDDNSLRDA